MYKKKKEKGLRKEQRKKKNFFFRERSLNDQLIINATQEGS